MPLTTRHDDPKHLRFSIATMMSFPLIWCLSTSSANSKLHQMIHECLKTDVVREDRLCALAYSTVPTSTARVGGGRIELRQQETSLRTTGVTDNETGKREAVLDEFLYSSVSIILKK
jgi:hypothetical protein